jgi:hypothetical protein
MTFNVYNMTAEGAGHFTTNIPEETLHVNIVGKERLEQITNWKE